MLVLYVCAQALTHCYSAASVSQSIKLCQNLIFRPHIRQHSSLVCPTKVHSLAYGALRITDRCMRSCIRWHYLLHIFSVLSTPTLSTQVEHGISLVYLEECDMTWSQLTAGHTLFCLIDFFMNT